MQASESHDPVEESRTVYPAVLSNVYFFPFKTLGKI